MIVVKAKPSEEVFIIANHPSVSGYDNLLELKQSDLKSKVKSLSLNVSLNENPLMRKAIWGSLQDLKLAERPLQVNKSKEDAKIIWSQIESYLPIFALFLK